jgi:hypothetical protein
VYTYVGGCGRAANDETLILLDVCGVVRDARHVCMVSVASRGLVLTFGVAYSNEGDDDLDRWLSVDLPLLQNVTWNPRPETSSKRISSKNAATCFFS